MKTVVWLLTIGIGIIIGCTLIRFCASTADTVHKEYNTGALLKKYEYFKDMASAIDRKRADIEVYRNDLESTDIHDKQDKEDYKQRKSEALGIILIYNGLVADYNAQMSKFNWRFCNVGDLPASNLEPLPREFKPYILSLERDKK